MDEDVPEAAQFMEGLAQFSQKEGGPNSFDANAKTPNQSDMPAFFVVHIILKSFGDPQGHLLHDIVEAGEMEGAAFVGDTLTIAKACGSLSLGGQGHSGIRVELIGEDAQF